jgi:proline dehydrogenase
VALLDRAIVSALPAVPKPIVRRISQRYIAGERIEDACRVVNELNASGKMATIDVLGEEITTEEEARHIAYTYDDVFRAIDEHALDSNVSVKLTGLGLKLDREVARENLERTVRGAAERGNFVRIDMEDSSCTDDTLTRYRELRESGLGKGGIVVQGWLGRASTRCEPTSSMHWRRCSPAAPTLASRPMTSC